MALKLQDKGWRVKTIVPTALCQLFSVVLSASHFHFYSTSTFPPFSTFLAIAKSLMRK